MKYENLIPMKFNFHTEFLHCPTLIQMMYENFLKFNLN